MVLLQGYTAKSSKSGPDPGQRGSVFIIRSTKHARSTRMGEIGLRFSWFGLSWEWAPACSSLRASSHSAVLVLSHMCEESSSVAHRGRDSL